MFSVDVASIGRLNVVVASQAEAKLWHLRLGHLNYRSLMSMAQKKMVSGLAAMKQGPQCEQCVMSKQSRASFSQWSDVKN